MSRKRSTPVTRWSPYLLAGALLLAVLVASGISAQLFATTDAAQSSSIENAHPTLYAHGDRLRPLVEATNGAQTLNIYGPGGQIIAQVALDGLGGSQKAPHLLADHLGSTRAILDADDNVVAHFEYGPHGETAEASGVAAPEARYRYTGHPWDAPQGLYETPARTYDPTTGRFLSVDPQRQDASPYVYAGNNPAGFLDPTGGGGVPFFVYTGYKKTGSASDRNKSHIAHAIGANFGLDLTSSQRVLSADMFNTGGGGVGSYAEMQASSIMLGRGGSVKNFTYNGKMYWIVGGEEKVADMGSLKQGMAAFRKSLEGFPSEVTILNFSGDMKMGTNLRDKLRALNLNPLVVDAEQQGEWKKTSRGRSWELQGFTSRGESYTQNEFVDHVRSLEIGHNSKRLSKPEPTTSGEPNDIPVHDTQTTGQGEVAGDSSQGFYHEGEFIQFPTLPAVQGDGASGILPIPPNFVPIPQDLTDRGTGWVAQTSKWDLSKIFLSSSPE